MRPYSEIFEDTDDEAAKKKVGWLKGIFTIREPGENGQYMIYQPEDIRLVERCDRVIELEPPAKNIAA
jgi:hypothetical protein